MADAQYNLSLIITANNKAIEEINKIWTSVDKVKWNVLQFSESTKKVLKTVWVAATAVAWSMIAIWKSCVDAAIEIEPVKNAFQQLTDSVWESSDEMLKSLREASKWAVKDYDLMLAANTSMKLWVATNTEDMTQLMKIARLYWQQMWEDTSQAFDDIVRWLWRGSAQILDNLWIVVDSEKAYDDYAKQIWKTAKQLTDAEKKQAIVNATLVEWQKALEKFWEPLPTMWERIAALQNQFEWIKVKLWEALLPIVEKLMNIITPIIERVSERINTHSELAAKIWVAITVVAWLVAALSWLALILPAITTAIWVLTWPIWLVIAAIWLLATARAKDRWWIREKTQVAVEHIQSIIGPRLEKLKARRTEHGETVMIYVQAVMWAIADTIWTVLWLIATWIAIVFQNIQSSFQLFSAIRKWDRDKVWEICINRVHSIDNILTKAFWETRTNIKEWLQQFIDDVVAKFTALKDKIKSIVDSIKNLWNSTKEAVWWAAKSARNFVSSPFKAWWWDVYWWQSYIVWEKWPELFVPNSNWKIVSNSQLWWTWWIEINVNMWWVNVSNDVEVNSMAERVGEVIMRQLELYQKWIR